MPTIPPAFARRLALLAPRLEAGDEIDAESLGKIFGCSATVARVYLAKARTLGLVAYPVGKLARVSITTAGRRLLAKGVAEAPPPRYRARPEDAARRARRSPIGADRGGAPLLGRQEAHRARA